MPQYVVLLVAPPQFRARITSIALLIYNGAGPTLGPLMAAKVADAYHGSAALGLSLASVGAVLTPIGLALYLLARKPFAEVYLALPAAERAELATSVKSRSLH
jgi:hypothetical protein